MRGELPAATAGAAAGSAATRAEARPLAATVAGRRGRDGRGVAHLGGAPRAGAGRRGVECAAEIRRVVARNERRMITNHRRGAPDGDRAPTPPEDTAGRLGCRPRRLQAPGGRLLRHCTSMNGSGACRRSTADRAAAGGAGSARLVLPGRGERDGLPAAAGFPRRARRRRRDARDDGGDRRRRPAAGQGGRRPRQRPDGPPPAVRRRRLRPLGDRPAAARPRRRGLAGARPARLGSAGQGDPHRPARRPDRREHDAAEIRAYAFSFHRGLDHLGAAVGPLVAAAVLLAAPGRTCDRVFALATVPALDRLGHRPVRLARGRSRAHRDEPRRRRAAPERRPPWPPGLGPLLARFSPLRAGQRQRRLPAAARRRPRACSAVGLALLWSGFHLVRSLASAPAGRLADRIGHRRSLRLGWTLYAASYLGFALTDGPASLALLLVPYAFAYGLTEGAERALVAGGGGGRPRGRSAPASAPSIWSPGSPPWRPASGSAGSGSSSRRSAAFGAGAALARAPARCPPDGPPPLRRAPVRDSRARAGSAGTRRSAAGAAAAGPPRRSAPAPAGPATGIGRRRLGELGALRQPGGPEERRGDALDLHLPARPGPPGPAARAPPEQQPALARGAPGARDRPAPRRCRTPRRRAARSEQPVGRSELGAQQVGRRPGRRPSTPRRRCRAPAGRAPPPAADAPARGEQPRGRRRRERARSAPLAGDRGSLSAAPATASDAAAVACARGERGAPRRSGGATAPGARSASSW